MIFIIQRESNQPTNKQTKTAVKVSFDLILKMHTIRDEEVIKNTKLANNKKRPSINKPM